VKLDCFDCSDKENVSLQSLVGHNIQEFCHASDVAQMKKHYAEGRFLLILFSLVVMLSWKMAVK